MLNFKYTLAPRSSSVPDRTFHLPDTFDLQDNLAEDSKYLSDRDREMKQVKLYTIYMYTSAT